MKVKNMKIRFLITTLILGICFGSAASAEVVNFEMEYANLGIFFERDYEYLNIEKKGTQIRSTNIIDYNEDYPVSNYVKFMSEAKFTGKIRNISKDKHEAMKNNIKSIDRYEVNHNHIIKEIEVEDENYDEFWLQIDSDLINSDLIQEGKSKKIFIYFNHYGFYGKEPISIITGVVKYNRKHFIHKSKQANEELQKANKYLKRKWYGLALSRYESALYYTPENSAALYGACKSAYSSMKKFDEVLEYCGKSRVLQKKPLHKADVNFMLAETTRYYAEKINIRRNYKGKIEKYEESVIYYQEALKYAKLTDREDFILKIYDRMSTVKLITKDRSILQDIKEMNKMKPNFIDKETERKAIERLNSK